MDSFNTQKQKIRNLYNTNKDNNLNINKKINTVKNVNLDQNELNSSKEILNTGDLTPSVTYIYNTNIDQNKLLPVNYRYQFCETLEIPESIIPFIDFQLSFSSPGDRNLVASCQLELDSWDSSFYDISGDGNQIWKGITPPSTYPRLYSNSIYDNFTVDISRINDGSVLEAMTRPAWKCTVNWTHDGEQFKIVAGAINGFRSNYYNTSVSECGGNTNYYFLYGSLWYDTTTLLPEGDIISFTGSDFKTLNVTGVEYYQYWTGTEESCVSHHSSTSDVSKSLNLNTDIDYLYVYGTKLKLVNGRWLSYPSNYYLIIGSDITSIVPTQERYYTYWDAARRFLFSITQRATPVINNLPIKTIYNNLVYNEYNILINPNDYPKRLSERTGELTHTFNQAQHYNVPTIDPFWFKSSKSTDSKELWTVNCNVAALLMTEASLLTNGTYPYWNDTYIQNMDNSGYIINTSSHSTKTRPYYSAPSKPITVKCVARARMPLNYKKTLKTSQYTT